jgi:hypothetical protein
MESENSFYVVCPSNASMELYSANTPGHFRINLPKRLTFRGRYEVGLAEVTYPVTWDTFQAAKDYRIKASFNDKLGQGVLTRTLYLTVDELIKEVISKVADATDVLAVHLRNILQYDNFKNRIKYVMPSKFKIRLSQSLSDALGFRNNVWIEGRGEAAYPPDIRIGMHALFVYSNIVEPQLVGDAYAPLLRTISVAENDKRGAQHQRSTFESPHYVPVITDEISTIEIILKNDSGETVSFATGKTVCTLHFRRKSL